MNDIEQKKINELEKIMEDIGIGLNRNPISFIDCGDGTFDILDDNGDEIGWITKKLYEKLGTEDKILPSPTLDGCKNATFR